MFLRRNIVSREFFLKIQKEIRFVLQISSNDALNEVFLFTEKQFLIMLTRFMLKMELLFLLLLSLYNQ